jgi:hypothetical protein
MYKMIGGDGKEYGPVPLEQLRQWMAEGRVNAQTQVQPEGATGWQALGTIPELAAPAPSAPPPVFTPPPATAQPLPVGSVPNYLVQSILVTLCCCLPLGIPAIIFAAQVNGKLRSGDLAGAQESSAKAKKWCWIAFILGLIANIIGGIIQFAMIQSGKLGRF